MASNIDLDLMKNAAKVFQSACIPIITNVSLEEISPAATSSAMMNLSVTWEQSNHSMQKKSSFTTLYSLNISIEKKLQKLSSFPIDYSKPLLEALSSSKNWKAKIRKHTNQTTKKDEQILEIWSSKDMMLEKVLNLSSFDQHGDINTDVVFASLCWSPDEQKLVYVAERKQEKSCGFFEKPPSDTKDVQFGTKYVYEEDWGELLTGIVNPVICVIDVSKETLNVCCMKDLQGICPSQPQWGPNNSIIFSGIQSQPFRLGIIYCNNRTSNIYMLTNKDDDDSSQTILKLSETDSSSDTSPRVNPGMTKLLFIHRKLSPNGDPHRGSESIAIFDFKEKKTVYLENLLYEGKHLEFCTHMLPVSVWLDDNFAAIPTTYHAKMYVCIVDTLSGTITGMVECSNFFGVDGDFIFTSTAKLNEKSVKLQVVNVSNGNPVDVITDSTSTMDTNLSKELITNEYGIISYYLTPTTSESKIPLIVCAHGGPHSIFTDDYYATFSAFCCLGFAVLLVNYRGSTSFSTDSLLTLPGKVGDQDVKEVQDTVSKFVESKKDVIDENNIFYLGGSHGGFLGAHLLGQYPDYYQAAALRNPVIDIATMTMITDIPDWCYVEAGIPYNQGIIPNPDDYKQMLTKSPIVHLQNIKAPILLCIGGKDARVPPSQGKGFYRLLKANNKTAKLLFYPNESHPLIKEVAGDVFMNTYQWFNKYMKK